MMIVVAQSAWLLPNRTDSRRLADFGPTADMMSGPLYIGMSVMALALIILSGVLALVSARGLLLMRQWSRHLATVFAGTLFVMFLISIISNLSNYAYGLSQMEQAAGDSPDVAEMYTLAFIIRGIIISAVFYALYPALLMYFLRRPHVVEAFRLANWDATVEAEEAS
jgi:hypothetical protein